MCARYSGFLCDSSQGRDVAIGKTASGETKEFEGNQDSRLTPQHKMHGMQVGRRARGKQWNKRGRERSLQAAYVNPFN